MMSSTTLFGHSLIRRCCRNVSQSGKIIAFNRSLKLKTGVIGLVLSGSAVKALTTTDNNSESKSNVVSNVYGAIRFFRSLKIGLWISLDYYFSMMGLDPSSQNYKIMMSRIHQRAADHILHGCLTNGGSYIKLGQGLVAMNQILPTEYINTLKVLHDKCLNRKEDEVRQIFIEEFGNDPEEMFASFDSEPIAAASIAQVYKAKTKDQQNVAVKVQYADLKARFKSDVFTIKGLLAIAGFMHPNFNFAWVVTTLEDALKQELDFVNEGLNAERCAKDLQHLNYIHIPKVYWDYTSSRVLVTEFIDGYKINEVDKLKKENFSLVDINRKLFEAFGHQIFQTGFVHADPHPGNILVRKNKNKSELVLLDHGLYQQVSEKDRIALSNMWKAVVLNDHVNMKKYSHQLGVKDHELFAEILTQAPLKSYGFKLKTKLSEADMKHITEFARDRFDSIMTCLHDMPTTLLLVIRNLNTIRAISHDHGSPIDRYSVLARCATRTAYSYQNKITSVWHWPSLIYFEIMLSFKRVTRWFQEITYKFLYKLGMMPDIMSTVAKFDVIV